LGVDDVLTLCVHCDLHFLIRIRYKSTIQITRIVSFSRHSFSALAFATSLLDDTFGSGSAVVDLDTVEQVPVTLLILGGGAEVPALASISGAPALSHFPVLTDGAGEVRVVPVAGPSCGGEGVLVRRNSITALPRLGTLTPFLHGSSTLLPSVLTSATSVPERRIKLTGSVSHRFPVLLSLRVLLKLLGVHTGTVTGLTIV